jgi:hypothetical protein
VDGGKKKKKRQRYRTFKSTKNCTVIINETREKEYHDEDDNFDNGEEDEHVEEYY